MDPRTLGAMSFVAAQWLIVAVGIPDNRETVGVEKARIACISLVLIIRIKE